MLNDQAKLATELKNVLHKRAPNWPAAELAAAAREVAAAVQVDGGLGLWTSDPPEWSFGPYRTLRADSKAVYLTTDQPQAAHVAAALNEITWRLVKAAPTLNLEAIAFLSDLADTTMLPWLELADASDLRRISKDVEVQMGKILEDQPSLRQQSLPERLRRLAEKMDQRK